MYLVYLSTLPEVRDAQGLLVQARGGQVWSNTNGVHVAIAPSLTFLGLPGYEVEGPPLGWVRIY